MPKRRKSSGQTLALFALFITVLLGVSALAIDYASWLLTDRALQNAADHASLAGASAFCPPGQTSCPNNLTTQATNGRLQAWTSLNSDLLLGLSSGTMTCLAAVDSPTAGDVDPSRTGCGTATSFRHRIWVDTPPPFTTPYQKVAGKYPGSVGIVFVRVDRVVTTFFGSIFRITPAPRTGWATAGILPTDFALSVYCRDNIAPESGQCATNSSLGIEGGGGVSLLRGDVASNNSLKVTQTNGQGVIVQDGNVFLVQGSCGSSTWSCPPATVGGISDGSGTAKNAFYLPPLPVPQYAVPPLNTTCAANSPCVPGTGSNNATPIDWSCGGSVACGTPTGVGNNTLQCVGSASSSTRHLAPKGDDAVTSFKGTQSGSTNNNIYRNINEVWPTVDPSGTTIPDPPSGATTFPSTPTPSSLIYSDDGSTASYRVLLGSPNGTIQPGFVYVRYVLFRTANGNYVTTAVPTAYPVNVTAQLQEKVGASWVNRGSSDTEPATETITAYQLPAVNTAAIVNPNALSILFTVATTPSSGRGDTNVRGAGISWAEADLDRDPVPPPPPTIPPGLYRSIVIPDGGCAILDPTGFYGGGLQQYQVPGVYHFTDASGGQNATISLGSGSYLIGDGVSLVFDDTWPGPNGSGGSANAHGIVVNSSGALVLNTGLASQQSCAQWFATNPSYPLCPLPADALGAAWGIDPTATQTGASAWGGACPNTSPCVLARSAYAPTNGYRGVTFYFRPKTNGSANPVDYSILSRFLLSGSAGGDPGIAFKGILYAPYDDVKITGSNNFNTIGMVVAWTAKFAGQASIKLDFPYARAFAPPYLLEPTVNQ